MRYKRETMEQNLNIPDSTGLTFEKVWLMMQKSDERFERRVQQERAERLALEKKREAERLALEKKREVERLESKKERDEQWKKDKAETKKLKEMIFGLGNNLGQITEDYFYNSVASDKKVAGIQYDRISRNLKMETKNLNGEYDIVLINSSRLLVIEVKQKPHIKDVEKFINKQLPNFRKLFPEYAKYTIYGAFAGMTFEENTLEYAKEKGLYVLTQNQENKNIQLLNKEGFKATEF